MKKLFLENNVKSAPWCKLSEELFDGYKYIMENSFLIEEAFPAIIKHKNSCKGKGIFLINNSDELDDFVNEDDSLNEYIIEKYYNGKNWAEYILANPDKNFRVAIKNMQDKIRHFSIKCSMRAAIRRANCKRMCFVCCRAARLIACMPFRQPLFTAKRLMPQAA